MKEHIKIKFTSKLSVASVGTDAQITDNKRNDTSRYNQTIMHPGEIYCLVPLILLWWRYLQKTQILSRIHVSQK